MKSSEIAELASLDNLSSLTSTNKRLINCFYYGISRKPFSLDGQKYFKMRFFLKKKHFSSPGSKSRAFTICLKVTTITFNWYIQVSKKKIANKTSINHNVIANTV